MDLRFISMTQPGKHFKFFFFSWQENAPIVGWKDNTNETSQGSLHLLIWSEKLMLNSGLVLKNAEFYSIYSNNICICWGMERGKGSTLIFQSPLWNIGSTVMFGSLTI